MTMDSEHKKRHFILEGVTETEQFRFQGFGPQLEIPPQDRQLQSSRLRQQLAEVEVAANSVVETQRNAGMTEGVGINVEFQSFPGIELAFESLTRENFGIELLNVRHRESDDNAITEATVFVPDGKLSHFERLISDYLEHKEDAIGRPRDNQRLIDAIQQIREASLRALWTDSSDFPTDDEGNLWWEVWVPVRKDRQEVIASFRAAIDSTVSTPPTTSSEDGMLPDTGMRASEGEIYFPERTVLLVYASVGQMQQSMLVLNSIAELKRARDTAEFFDSLRPIEQQEWLEDLLKRSTYPSQDDQVPYVCLLDTGVNRGHQLLQPALAAMDVHSINPSWGTDDNDGHGTEMAGLALVGNLADLLSSTTKVAHTHRLESVKLLPRSGTNSRAPLLHGFITAEAVYRPEVSTPDRARVFSMAVTAENNSDRGQPSAWSAAIDKITSDADDQGANRRLMVVSAGNTSRDDWLDYPASNDTDSIHDPAQAWNALTVGAYTELVCITEDSATDYEAIAPQGALSPFSTTSLTWPGRWPLKPDVVLEGGNVARESHEAYSIDSLSLLTAFHRPTERLFTTTCATSAATALAAKLAAEIMAEYPNFWPETIRGLLVHSAEWTDAMLQAYIPTGGNPSKADYARLIRRCGFGVPDLDRALWSVDNSPTMVIEESLYPFRRVKSKPPTLKDMNIHQLPWPSAILEDLGDEPVEMRVTLSYYIEPSPSQRGVRSRYRYESHGLRFDVNRTGESLAGFRSRINVAATDEDQGIIPAGSDSSWLIGPRQRHRGSIHGDIWRGTAADLASRCFIAVYPTSGWWKTRPKQERYNQPARYSLVVSISAPKTMIDLYSDIDNRVTNNS